MLRDASQRTQVHRLIFYLEQGPNPEEVPEPGQTSFSAAPGTWSLCLGSSFVCDAGDGTEDFDYTTHTFCRAKSWPFRSLAFFFILLWG